MADERVEARSAPPGETLFEITKPTTEAAGTSDAATAPVAIARLERLCRAERAVLRLIGDGFTTPQIAVALHRTPKTIEVYRSHICAKLALAEPTTLDQLAWRLAHGKLPGLSEP